MGNIKETFARKESSKLSAGSNTPVPPLVNKDDATAENINQQTTKVDEQYKRVKAELANESLKLQRLTEWRMTSQALSDPNASSIDRMFSLDSVGRYLYIGTSACCFDATSHACTFGAAPTNLPCKHELCGRARSSGISWTELDTIKWYDMRIRNEKTLRMRSALAKQRHVELARLKQSEDEENAKHVRRHKERNDATNQQTAHKPGSGTGDQLDPQDLDRLIFEARISTMHIHKYNVFMNARQQAMADIAEQSDVVSMVQLHRATRGFNDGRLEEKLQKAQFRSQRARKDVEWCKEKIAEAASASTIVADWQDFNLDLDFDGASAEVVELFNLVNGLLIDLGTPVDAIDKIEHAQSALRHIMSLPAKKKSLKVQTALGRIQKIICKIQKRSKQAGVSSPAPPYTLMSGLLGDLRNLLMSLLHGELADPEHLNPTQSELVRIEKDAKSKFHQVYQQLFKSPSELALSLARIEAQAVAKSPVPMITQILLDIVVSMHNDMSRGYTIIKELDQIDNQILVAKISGLVFARAEKKAEWLIQAFTAIEAMFEIVHMEGPLPDRIQHALQRVKTSVEARGKASQTAAVVSKRPEDSARQLTKLPTDSSQKQTSAPNAVRMVDNKFPNLTVENNKPFTAYEQSIVNMSELYSAETASMYTMHLFRHKHCPGCATLRISQLVAALFVRSPSQMNETIAALTAGHPANTGEEICPEALGDFSNTYTWRRHVCHGVQCIAEMYDMLASLAKPNCSLEEEATFIGNTIVKILKGVLLDIDPEEALTQLSTMNWDSSQRLLFKFLLAKVLDDETFYCSVSGDPCFRRASRLSPKKTMVSEPDVSHTSTRGLSKDSRRWQGEAQPNTITSVVKKSISTIPGSMTVSIVPGPPRRKLLPRGERHQDHFNAMKAAANVACMNIGTAKKIFDFLIFQRKAYERAGLAISPEVLNCIEDIRRTAYIKRGTQSQSERGPRVATRHKSAERTSNFIENLSEIDRNGFEVTIAGRAITEDELLGYTSATVERIRSIGSGQATLEYICWIAHKISLEADAAQAAGKKWTLPVKRFEEFFMQYTPMPRSLELALDYAKGRLWLSPDCLESYPTAEWPIIDDILNIIGKIDAKELSFAHDIDETWRVPSFRIPTSENVISYDAVNENLLKQEADVSAAVDQMFSDPVKFERLMEGWRTRLLTADDADVSEVDATVEQVRQLFRDGNIEVCKELVLAGVMCVQSAQQVKEASVAVNSDTNLVPLPLNIRKDWLDRVIGAESLGDGINEAPNNYEKHTNISEQELEQEQMRLERLQFEKETRQTEAIQAQLDAIRQSDDIIEAPPETTPVTEKSVQDLFRSYHASARPLIDYLTSFSTEDLRDERKHEEDPNIMIGGRFQMQYFDCMRMLQLMAENRGWTGTALSMKERIENCGDLHEDEEGHFPDYWDGGGEDDEEESLDDEQPQSSVDPVGQEA